MIRPPCRLCSAGLTNTFVDPSYSDSWVWSPARVVSSIRLGRLGLSGDSFVVREWGRRLVVPLPELKVF